MKPSHHYRPVKAPPRSRQKDYLLRLVVAFVMILVFFSVLVWQFVRLQVARHEEFVDKAAANRISLIPTPPIRGEITDVNGVVLAHNYPAYSLEVIPNELEMKVEDLIPALSPYVEISEADVKRFQRFRAESRSYERIPLKLKLSTEEAARLAAVLFRFKGVEVNARTFREYPYGGLTTHIVGYIGRISDKDRDQLESEDRYELYRGTTHIGKMGLENFYEQQLHGMPGYQEVEKDAQGNIVRTLKTAPAVSGQTLRLSLDIRMQQKASELLGNRRGAVVAIDPQTGGVLALVSKPTYDANLFIDGIDSDTWKSLNDDWQKPLINRVTQGLYPPGSTFKPFMGMAALQSGQITPNTVLPAPGAWSIPGSRHQFRDSVRSGHGSANLGKAIQVSSDTFFYRLGYEMGIEKAYPYLAHFGFGQPTGIDLPNEYKGILPSPEWKARRFAHAKNETARQWKPADMVTISIGQGFNAYTPLQMAHATATLANNGVMYRPHLVRELIDHQKQTRILVGTQPSATLPFKPEYFTFVKQSMERVLRPGGTAWRVGVGLKYSMGGKTGTAQVVQIRQGASYNAAALAERHRDHAWFIAFAPADNPKIAIAVLLENGGWGANAAPIARQLADFYLLQLQGENGKNLPLPKPAVPSAGAMSQAEYPLVHAQAERTLSAYRAVSGSLPAAASEVR